VVPLTLAEQTSPDGLQQQLDFLSGQVDELIAEIERLRTSGTADAVLPVTNRLEEQFAGMASHIEEVTLHNDAFAIYHLTKPDGETQRFAFHSEADGLEEPEPQKRLS